MANATDTLGMTKTAYANEVKAFIQHKIDTDPRWTKAAIKKIFEKQTEDEKRTEHTSNHNNVGFNGTDAPLMSSFAKQLLRGRDLSEKQMSWARRKMKKYWRQLMNYSDRAKLNDALMAWLDNQPL